MLTNLVVVFRIAYDQLARQAAVLVADDHQSDRRDHDQERAEGLHGVDEGTYSAKIKVSDSEMAALSLHSHAFHPEWNYTIAPRTPEPPPARQTPQPTAALA
jgi:hypothetical protein